MFNKILGTMSAHVGILYIIIVGAGLLVWVILFEKLYQLICWLQKF